MATKYLVRVYGVLIQNGALLVSDEKIMGKAITKLPGGGLEYGEGTLECVEREFYEEMNIKIEVGEHFYTTDFFVPSAFDPGSQIISIYYVVTTQAKFTTSTQPHAYEKDGGEQSFRWIPVSELHESDFSLVIDRKVAELIRAKF